MHSVLVPAFTQPCLFISFSTKDGFRSPTAYVSTNLLLQSCPFYSCMACQDSTLNRDCRCNMRGACARLQPNRDAPGTQYYP